MAKKVLVRIMLFIVGTAILICAAILPRMLREIKQRGVIEVKLEDGKTHVLNFDEGGLVPGDECSYIVVLKKTEVDRYRLNFEFVETEDLGLKNFLRVKILSGEEVLLDELLLSVFEDDHIVIPVDFAKKKNTELRVVYYLPLEVGNEAKNAESAFELRLTATNE